MSYCHHLASVCKLFKKSSPLKPLGQFKPNLACLCSIYRHGGHDGWSAGSSDITFKGNPLRMIQAKFGLNWPSGFRGEDFLKSLPFFHQIFKILILSVLYFKKYKR
jgi:hypothetical protein